MAKADTLFTDGKAYERLMGRWSRLVGEVFLGWLAVPRGLRWLDVGCGNGAFTEEVVDRCAPSAVSVKVAEFHIGDAQKLPFEDDSFDVAVAALVISFLRDPPEAISEMARVVRAGGWVATYMWDIPGGGAPTDPIYVALESMGMTSVRPANPVVSGREVMQDLWEKAGLESIDTQVIRIPIVYRDFDDFWESNTVLIGPQGKIISGMSTSEREKLRTDLRNRLPTASDGRIVYESFAAVKGRVRG